MVTDWTSALTAEHGNPFVMLGVALVLVFPKLALGMSGFETGVAVMPHVEGGPGDTEENPVGRIRRTKKLLDHRGDDHERLPDHHQLHHHPLIPETEFEAGGKANGRALAYLAHQYLGYAFGTVYDISTIAILWFAGASAMAGLLNLIPRYLPRYGMAPEWTAAVRPLVLIFTSIAFAVTSIFNAERRRSGRRLRHRRARAVHLAPRSPSPSLRARPGSAG